MSNTPAATGPSPYVSPIVAAIVSWIAISLGFFGLKILMQERPEFVGQPTGIAKSVLVQESPQLVLRKVGDDVSVVRWTQPSAANIRFEMQGRRDYRGLKTISDMAGQFTAQYALSNSATEPLFVLFKCPHPRSEAGESVLAGGLKLQASVPGTQDNAKDSWLWSGTIPAQSVATVDITYQVGSLKGVVYRVVPQHSTPANQVRVSFAGQDLAAMHFESGSGPIANVVPVTWERNDFLGPDFFAANIVESRNLFTSLLQLAEIGPLISLLFILAVVAVLVVRQQVTAIQMFTISAGYAIYFPLMLYLSARFSFVVALGIAFIVPGVLLINYARWLLGGKPGLIGAPVFLAIYQVFPTLAVFAGWNRGMVLLCLGVVTLWVLISVQNRTLRNRVSTAAATALLMLVAPASFALGSEVQVLLPGELAGKIIAGKPEKTASLLAYQPVNYNVRQDRSYFRVEAQLAFRVLRVGELPTALFSVPVHLEEYRLESGGTNLAQLVTLTNQLGLLAEHSGNATLLLVYRVPIEHREGKARAQIPVLLGPSGTVRLQSTRDDLEIMGGSLWTRGLSENLPSYEIGVSAGQPLLVEWREQDGELGTADTRSIQQGKQLYGIGLKRAQNLTIINSDASCTHFVEYEVPAYQKEEFRLLLPLNARLISASINGTEMSAPNVEDRLCRVRLPERMAEQQAHRLSFRLAYPQVKLGFVGSIELTLPEVFQTAGTLEWVVVLPDGFEAQVISSGLETQRVSPDLSVFGDYGRVLKSHPQTCLAKTLAPPGVINLHLKYRQMVPGIYDVRVGEDSK